jgi:protein arginine kinase activator
MLCQQCQKREANVHFTQILNGTKMESYLCSQCANEKGKITLSPQLNLGDFLWGFPGFGEGGGYTEAEQPREVRCELCGMSFDDFRKTGKVGCANCYRTFRDNLGPILRRLHGSTEHKGKIPGKLTECIKTGNEIEKLKEELTAAIGREEYEKAAELRDRIRTLEGSGNKCGGTRYE